MTLPIDAILDRCRILTAIATAVVHPVQANVIRAVAEAQAEGLITPVLVGPRERITAAAAEAGVDIAAWALVDTEHSHAAAGAGRADRRVAARGHRHEGLAAFRRVAGRHRSRR